MARRSEIRRQTLHVAVGAIALSLAWLTWWQAALLAITAAGFNRIVLPHISPGVFRDGDLDRPWTSGIVVYPLAVLGLILVFRHHLEFAAAAWGVLAAGDGMATLVGTTVRSARLPWNRDKSAAGLVAFIVAASGAAIGLLAWTSDAPVSDGMILAGVLAALVAGFVETIPIRLNDNISVPVAAALVLWSTTLVDPALMVERWPDVREIAAYGLAVNAAVALIGWLARTVTIPGAVTGACIGTVVVAGAGWAGWALLMLTFVIASACTRIGHARKAAGGIAEDRGGRRGPGNALANTGMAAWASAMAIGLPDPTPAWLVATAALATAGSDTVASEIGKAYGRTTWLVTRFVRVPPGTTGAVSLEGTAAGLLAATLLAAAGAGLGLVPGWTIGIIAVAATVASLAEGVLGATLEDRGILNNDTLNFVNAAIGAGLTVGLWRWWP